MITSQEYIKSNLEKESELNDVIPTTSMSQNLDLQTRLNLTDKYTNSEKRQTLVRKTSTVTLPKRYRILANHSDGWDVNGNKNKYDVLITSREKDLGMALAWISNELVLMKKQDEILLQRFIQLRTTILQLRCMRQLSYMTFNSSYLDNTCLSLNELGKYSHVRTDLRTEDEKVLPSLNHSAWSTLLPCSPSVPQPRWAGRRL